jgi:hypothetical protein
LDVTEKRKIILPPEIKPGSSVRSSSLLYSLSYLGCFEVEIHKRKEFPHIDGSDIHKKDEIPVSQDG